MHSTRRDGNQLAYGPLGIEKDKLLYKGLSFYDSFPKVARCRRECLDNSFSSKELDQKFLCHQAYIWLVFIHKYALHLEHIQLFYFA